MNIIRDWLRIRATGLLAALGLLLAVSVQAQEVEAQEVEAPAALMEKLQQSLVDASNSQLQIVGVKLTPLADIFEVELNTGELLYTDASGDYLFAGDMYQTTAAGLLNLSTSTRQDRAREKIAAIPESEMIIFSPAQTRASITVFTDVDCTYCRALHRDLEELLARGIEVRYIAYPRGGMQAGSYDKMISVWCSDDRKKSLTQAKNGQNLPARDCETPILAHYELGNELGISGTPAIIFPDGRLIPGYLDSETLTSMLQLD